MSTARLAFISFLLLLPFAGNANEGLWLPLHLDRLRGIDLQKAGLNLTPEEIYSINSSSLKDAIVTFNDYCTGQVISKAGLILTNHHCGYRQIQQASYPMNNLLEKGFWAYNNEQEIPIHENKVSFLVRIEEVTDDVLTRIGNSADEKEREEMIKEISADISEKAIYETHYDAEVKSFYHGNEFYLFIYETFQDIRLAGTPPESIARFGGDKDNYDWPSHTGDFALFRIYAGADGKPATYSSSNKPLICSRHLVISLSGVKEGSPTMVMGFPAKTRRYSSSFGVKHAIEQVNPAELEIIEKQKEILYSNMAVNPQIRLAYASQLVDLTNTEKYYRGQTEMVRNLGVIEKKKEEELDFDDWSGNCQGPCNPENSMENLSEIYREMAPLSKFKIYLVDGIFSSDLLLFTYHFSGLYQPLAEKYPKLAFEDKIEELQKLASSHFISYHEQVDLQMTAAMMELFYNNIPAEQQPAILQKLGARSQGDFYSWCEKVFKKTIFTDSLKVRRFLENPSLKTLKGDPVYRTMRALVEHYYGNVAYPLKEKYTNLNQWYRLRQQALKKNSADSMRYPDANGTMRVSFGEVKTFRKEDGLTQEVQTTLSGLIRKSVGNKGEYQVHDKLIHLYHSGISGRYSVAGDIPVAFLTDNDISSGSSGSPVLNSYGELVGIVSDSNREALAGDFYYSDRAQRSVNIDIRYVLFIVDEFGEAGNLIKEMTLVD